MLNLSSVVGTLMQSGMSRSSTGRLRSTLRAGGRGSGEGLSGLLDGLQGGGGIGGMLQGVLGDATRSIGGKQNLALGGIGALAGALLGGGGGAFKGALGGGAMALLGALAFSALKGGGDREPAVPLGLREPQSVEENEELEANAELVLKAMINAAKADGQVDLDEMQRIIGKLEEAGADSKIRDYVLEEMKKPIDLEGLVAPATGQPELAAQLYAASLFAIEVDTPGERAYMQKLASGLGLAPSAVERLEDMVGLHGGKM